MRQANRLQKFQVRVRCFLIDACGDQSVVFSLSDFGQVVRDVDIIFSALLLDQLPLENFATARTLRGFHI